MVQSPKMRKRCGNAHKNYLINQTKDDNSKFWTSIKPFFTNKGGGGSGDLLLMENQKLQSDPSEIAETMNEFFVNVATHIGKDNPTGNYEEHPGILEIRDHSKNETFKFVHCKSEEVLKILKKLNVKKATGYDQIPAKLIKYASVEIAPVISWLINKSIDSCTFPKIMKMANVSPIYKKSDKLNKGNHRPVSVLTTLSKVF